MSIGAWKTTTFVLLAATVITSSVAGFYYQQFTATVAEHRRTLDALRSVSYTVHLLVQGPEGRVQWFNGTRIPIGVSVFNATLSAVGGQLEFQWFPELGPFVKGIQGISAASKPEYKDYWWSLWIWDSTGRRWRLSEVGAGQLRAASEAMYAWKFVPGDKFPPDPPGQ